MKSVLDLTLYLVLVFVQCWQNDIYKILSGAPFLETKIIMGMFFFSLCSLIISYKRCGVGQTDNVQNKCFCEFRFFPKFEILFLNLTCEQIYLVHFQFVALPSCCSSFSLAVSSVTMASPQPLSNIYHLVVFLLMLFVILFFNILLTFYPRVSALFSLRLYSLSRSQDSVDFIMSIKGSFLFVGTNFGLTDFKMIDNVLVFLRW